MQNKGAIRLFTILFALVCLYQLSFTFVSRNIEKHAKEFANGDALKEVHYLDSMSGQTVYNIGIQKYTYKQVKQRELNLGLDLKGGMNVTLEVSVVDLVRSMANHTKDETFNKAISMALKMQENSQEDFVTLFGQAIEKIDPNVKLAAFFATPELKEKINFESTNQQVLEVIKKEADAAIDNSFNILRSRIDRFGVTQPNIQKLAQRGRILVELPGVKDKERVRNLLQGTASLEFWETYENQEAFPYLMQANNIIRELKKAGATITTATTEAATTDTTKANSSEASLLDELKDSKDTTKTSEVSQDNPLFSVLVPNVSQQNQYMPGPVVGFSHVKDTATVRAYLNLQQVRGIIPHNMIFRWSLKPYDKVGNYYQLVALKVTTRDGSAPLDGGVITDARQDFESGKSAANVEFSVNSEGSKTWARITRDNIGRSVAIVLDGYVVSFPTVQVEITGGRSSITGNFTVEEAKDLANMLKSGKMPAPATIVEEYVVGPSLGKESINSGLWSFVFAFLLVLGYMMLMYSYQAGGVANIALVTNVFFLFGVLASFGAVLTLPGIAGIVLTMGMAVDANVLIYERIQEEMKGGKGLRLAIQEGYQHAYSAIIDGQVTTLLTGIALYIFGSGPIKGFATTLIIGILTSLFTAIFISRLIFERMLGRDMKIKFISKIAENILQNVNFKFINKRKYAYIFSGVTIAASLISFAVKGFDYGVDFKGGRTYVVAFHQPVKVAEVSKLLTIEFESAPEVKTFGGDNQVRITTGYKIEDKSTTSDNQVEEKLYQGLKPLVGSDVSIENFRTNYIRSSSKVGPTISDDIKRDAVLAILVSILAIFLYIVVRFKNWQYGLGGVVSLAHDGIFTMGAFSIFAGILPFSLEVDQSFIAAILTVLGYSINDTVIIFDRIREYLGLHPKWTTEENMDAAINHTLRRTVNTSSTTLVTLFAIFIFGGETIRGFAFALLVGILIGTYSSIFVATPIAYDTKRLAMKRQEKRKK